MAIDASTTTDIAGSAVNVAMMLALSNVGSTMVTAMDFVAAPDLATGG